MTLRALWSSADGGVTMTAEQRIEVDALLDQLETIGSAQQPRPLDNPLLFGNYNVAYTSTARAPTERSQRESRSIVHITPLPYMYWQGGILSVTDSSRVAAFHAAPWVVHLP